MSSKAAKRRAEYEKREAKRNAQKRQRQMMREAKNIEELAAAMGIKLK